VWRSILSAQFIVRGGARWSIGAGTSIPILSEPWLLNGECIDGNIVGAHHVCNITIDNLMVPNEKRSNETVVRLVFCADLPNKIMSTPLIAHVQPDRLIWKAERHGKYYVKSGYRLCVEELIDSSHLHLPGSWSGIWNLKVPPKVRNLVWRMCKGCLRTRVRLQDIGVHCPTQCVSGASGYEDLAHLIFDCPSAMQV